jgi:hypothetical protein
MTTFGNTAAIARPTEEVFEVTVSHLEEPGRFRKLLAEVRLGLPARADHPTAATGGPDPLAAYRAGPAAFPLRCYHG